MSDKNNISPVPHPALLAIFQKRIDGDDALLGLARLRFKEAGLGTEFYAETPDKLDWLLRFKPTPETPAVAHLPREIDLFDDRSHRLILDFATRFKERILGLVIHDQIEIATRLDDYVAALEDLDRKLKNVERGPYLFVEYAVGLEPGLFLNLFESIRDLKRVSACVDIGHIGIWQVKAAYSRNHPEEDVCALTPHDQRLKDVMEDVESAVRSALPLVLRVIRALGKLKKPLHVHLHDGHPLWTFSPFGVSDHISFLNEIPIPFEYKGKRSLPLMFGRSGLTEILTKLLESFDPDCLSLTLEIHPDEGRLSLGDSSYLFDHWEDKTNAEKMNYWLSVLLQNHQYLLETLRSCEKTCVRSTFSC